MITRRLLQAGVAITAIAQAIQAASPLKAISEKTCGVYTKGQGELTLCIESVTKWGTDVVQVNAVLENTGPVKLCDLDLEMENFDTLFSVWPEWAREKMIVDNFAPQKSTGVGLTAPYQPDGSFPHITVKDFSVCGVATREPLAMKVVDLDSVKIAGSAPQPVPMGGRKLAEKNVNHKHQQHLAAHHSRESAKRALQAPAPTTPVPIAQSRPVMPGECAIFTNGHAELTLCLESVVRWGSDIQQVRSIKNRSRHRIHLMVLSPGHAHLILPLLIPSPQVNGFISNTGKVQICDFKVSPVNVREIQSFWPDGATSTAYENFFAPAKVTAVGE